MSSLGDAVKLPCGLVLPYLFVKAAMAERIAESGHNPTPLILDLYNQWGQDGWGALLTGNVQVDVNHLGTPGDPALHDEYTGKENNEGLVATWAKYAQACQQHGTPGIVQICHPGRQLLRGAGTCGLFASTIVPSALPLLIGDGLLDRIFSTITQFIDTARLMADSGFSGIELHGADEHLIDAYGGSPEKRANSSTFEETMTQVGLLVEAGVDFLVITEQKSASTAVCEAFFIEFATVNRKRYPNIFLMLTGGFRSRAAAQQLLTPNSPNCVLDETVPDGKAQLLFKKIPAPFYARFLPTKVISAGLELTYYCEQMRRIAKGLKTTVPSV
ncbi:uncharacterized protein BDW43DRAFT_301454 [Aspergillus alliaceus]|uniref:uncharacterized protein n=1 Tax=Petromyces alliaceus TaxID=209559 RepID=UPI0012A50CC8|nr:uncharacterized protein BDW43DRAFT_301454 [Aspergillus alliaceus]KAB8231744.1 hypothetical protein BDW43DRAFT_301454 [Aspergillus alliaceus]